MSVQRNFDRKSVKSAGAAARLLVGVSAIAVGLSIGTPAFAQDQSAVAAGGNPPQTGSSEQQLASTNGEDEIVITGIRASLKRAVDIKRNAEQIVDSITAQDIGALPDRSVSEALQRIPGVTLQRTNENRDPARLAAEGGGVFIRGLSWVRSELNGRDIFSANSGRALSFEDISSDLLAGIDVYKNPSAELIEGGVGGLVNLRTRKPFDQKGQLIAISGDFNYADLRKKGFWSGNALYSNRWESSSIGEFGILVSASIGNIGNRTDSVQTGRYEPRTAADGSTVYIPNSLGARRIDWQQKRTSFSGSLQWRPTPEFEITAEAIWARATPKDIEYSLGDYAFALPTDDPSYTFNDQGVLQSGNVAGRFLDPDTRYGKRKSTTKDFSLNMRWTPTDNWAFSADVQRVESSTRIISMTAYTEPQDGYTVDFDLSGDDPTLVYSAPGDPNLDKSRNWWAAAMDHLEHNTAHEWAYRADAEYSFKDGSFLKSFRAGVRATNKDAVTRQTGYNWALLSNQHWAGGSLIPTYIDEQGNPPNAGLPDQTTLITFNNFFRGNISNPGSFWFPAASLVSHGNQNAYSYLKSTLSNGWGWAPLTDANFETAAPGADNVSGGINDQQEDTLAGYALVRFGSDGPLHFDGNVGVRVIQTKNDASGPALRIAAIQNTADVPTCLLAASAAGLPASTCDALAAAYAFSSGNPNDLQVDGKNKYTNVLPSLNLRFFLQDNLQLRLAAARAMVRPNFNQLNPFTQLSFSFQPTGFPPGVGVPGGTELTPFTGIGGSPRLKPTTSDQFDASLEYYFGSANSLTFAAFYKHIKNYIFAGESDQSFTAGGQTIDFRLTRQMNGDKGSIKGFELAYQQFYDFLPGALSGLGLQANLTYVDSSGGRNSAVDILEGPQLQGAADQTLPLEGMSKWAYNIAAIYEKYGISARLAYNWRSHYLLTTSAANIQRPVWSESYGQLDGSILYSVTRNIKLGVQGTNLLNSRTFLDVGGSDLRPRYSWTDTDRRIAFLLRAQF